MVFNSRSLFHVHLLVVVIQAQGVGGAVASEVLVVRGDPLGAFDIAQRVGGPRMDGEI